VYLPELSGLKHSKLDYIDLLALHNTEVCQHYVSGTHSKYTSLVSIQRHIRCQIKLLKFSSVINSCEIKKLTLLILLFSHSYRLF